MRPPSTPALRAVSIAVAASSRRSSNNAFLRSGQQALVNLRKAGACRGIRRVARQFLPVQIQCVIAARFGQAIRRESRIGSRRKR